MQEMTGTHLQEMCLSVICHAYLACCHIAVAVPLNAHTDRANAEQRCRLLFVSYKDGMQLGLSGSNKSTVQSLSFLSHLPPQVICHNFRCGYIQKRGVGPGLRDPGGRGGGGLGQNAWGSNRGFQDTSCTSDCRKTRPPGAMSWATACTSCGCTMRLFLLRSFQWGSGNCTCPCVSQANSCKDFYRSCNISNAASFMPDTHKAQAFSNMLLVMAKRQADLESILCCLCEQDTCTLCGRP